MLQARCLPHRVVICFALPFPQPIELGRFFPQTSAPQSRSRPFLGPLPIAVHCPLLTSVQGGVLCLSVSA